MRVPGRGSNVRGRVTQRSAVGEDRAIARRGKRRAINYLVTCEHGGNQIPPAYRSLFRHRRRLLNTHRGYDPGALGMARTLARALSAPLVASTVSRLLIELNRSPGHPQLYSEGMRGAPPAIRDEVYARFYLPYRAAVEATVRTIVARRGSVIHLSSHSFTPQLDGVVRNADIGLLYDPSRPGEVALCARWQAALRSRAPAWVVRRNYPYTGKSDGLTAYLRRRFAPDAYIGVELEINQKHVFGEPRSWARMRSTIVAALREAIVNTA